VAIPATKTEVRAASWRIWECSAPSNASQLMSLGHTVRGVVPWGAAATVKVHSSGTRVNAANSSTPTSDQIDTGSRVSA
jgi:hypothetical protein